MDGVVIHVSRDGSRAIVWCNDHGPLGLARRDAMPPALKVGEVVRFEAIEDAGMRLCGRLTRVDCPPVEGLADSLRSIAEGARAPLPRPSHLRLVAQAGAACPA
jgi:hypothetical protein